METKISSLLKFADGCLKLQAESTVPKTKVNIVAKTMLNFYIDTSQVLD